jgi:hypothetical protein
MSSIDPGAPEAEPPGSEVDAIDDEPTDGVAETDLPGVNASGETLAPQTTRNTNA